MACSASAASEGECRAVAGVVLEEVLALRTGLPPLICPVRNPTGAKSRVETESGGSRANKQSSKIVLQRRPLKAITHSHIRDRKNPWVVDSVDGQILQAE